MLKLDEVFSGCSVDDVEKAREFCGGVLGMDVTDTMGGALDLEVGAGRHVFLYPKANHEPATYTCLNFPTDDIDAAVAELRGKGITFEQYEGLTDEGGIARGRQQGMGPDIAWFKDPAGNILAVLQN